MRLTEFEIKSIKSSFESILKIGNIYLFGSRTNDKLRGGDIDLYLEIDDRSNLCEKKIRFLAKIKKNIGDQKVDIVFHEDENHLIEKEIQKVSDKVVILKERFFKITGRV